ncbi:MAG TPA: energy transducer TonB [Pyrinomonadaceae bacterium]|nr:energy transducer TonB [Pyrinomonadaceae bacterium]
MMLFRTVVIVLLLLGISLTVLAQTESRRTTVAILPFGNSSTAVQATHTLAKLFESSDRVQISDLGQAQAAASGAGYTPSLNMLVSEARTVGAAIGTDFFVVGDAQTLKRSPSTGPIYFDSYASIFIVSSRTGQLARWRRLNFSGPDAATSEKQLLEAIAAPELRSNLEAAMANATFAEREAREAALDRNIPVIAVAPDDEKTAVAQGLRLPRPFKRLQPLYPPSAAEAEAEATVDVLVDLDSAGEVSRAEIIRWAGFGLDDSTLLTVRNLHFFPAMRDGEPIPLRVLLRYNFRKPPK